MRLSPPLLPFAAAPPLPRGAKVVLVAGDADAANRRVDPRALERAVAALSGRGLGQLVLVTPAGGASGTGLFGLGGSKPKPGALSKLEEQVRGGAAWAWAWGQGARRARQERCTSCCTARAQLASHPLAGERMSCSRRWRPGPLPNPVPAAPAVPAPQVVESGLSYLIVRTASSDRVPDRYGEEASPVVAGLGALPAGLSISRSQVGCMCGEHVQKACAESVHLLLLLQAALALPGSRWVGEWVLRAPELRHVQRSAAPGRPSRRAAGSGGLVEQRGSAANRTAAAPMADGFIPARHSFALSCTAPPASNPATAAAAPPGPSAAQMPALLPACFVAMSSHFVAMSSQLLRLLTPRPLLCLLGRWRRLWLRP